MGTWERGLSRYKEGRFDSFTDRGVLGTALAEDSEGGLWIGSFNGAARLKDGKLTDFKDELKLPGPAVQAILEDAAGALWFGTNAGLVRRRDGAVTAYTTKDGLAGDDVRAILEDRQGHLWIGTYSGVTRIADGKFSSWTKREGLKSNRVRSLHEDRSGAIWVGAYDGGLSRIKDGRVANITMDDGLFNNGVFRILEDARGNFWMSCNLGIYRVSRRQLDDFADGKIRAVNSIVYGKSDGMLNPECNGGYQPAGIRARDGKLWFPTQQGVAVIDPETVPFNPHPPPVVIEECLLDRAALDFSDQAQIAPSQRNLEIHYTALSFIKPEHIRFKYKLEGLDKDWVDAGTRRQAFYSYIPPGQYTFTVIAANSDGLWNTEGRSLRIIALPPFYRTWWFIFLTIHREEELFQAALDLGVKGYVLKDSAVTDIIAGIKAVAAGQAYLSPALSPYLLKRSERAAALTKAKPGINGLTPTERRILKLIAEEKTSKEIAEELFISPRTVETHRTNIARKLELHGSLALIKFAVTHKSELS
jgi:DNA-binding NarL/FixJ family response regulator